MADLSSVTGAATGTIFHHFKNKEELFLQVLQGVKEDIATQFKQHQQTCAAKNGMERVLEAVTFYLDLTVNREDQFLLLHRHDPYQMAETNPVCRSHLEAIYTGLLEILEQGIRKGLQDGSIQTKNPRKTAMVVFAMVDGIVRLNTYRIYDAGALYDDLMGACRKILENDRE